MEHTRSCDAVGVLLRPTDAVAEEVPAIEARATLLSGPSAAVAAFAPALLAQDVQGLGVRARVLGITLRFDLSVSREHKARERYVAGYIQKTRRVRREEPKTKHDGMWSVNDTMELWPCSFSRTRYG